MLDITLYKGDCLDLMRDIPDGSIDLVLTDPPYCISRSTNFASGEAQGNNTDRFRVSMQFGYWDESFKGIEIAIKETYRVLRQGGTLICFYDIWKITTLRNIFESVHFNQIRFLEWIKTNPVPLNSKTNYLTNAREIAILGVKGSKPTFHSEYDNGIYKHPICHDKDRFHPTQKPLALIEELVVKHSNEGDRVLDCFSGSGTTGVACVNTGRNFIGIEKDDHYFEVATNRINEATKEKAA